jgi:hypothetical protein
MLFHPQSSQNIITTLKQIMVHLDTMWCNMPEPQSLYRYVKGHKN